MLENIVTKVKTVDEGIRKKPDFVLFDSVAQGKLADKLRKEGWNVFGAHALADKLELDRKFGADFMEEHGIKIPHTTSFTKIADAIAYVKDKPSGYVIKMDAEDAAKASSYVGKTADDIAAYLDHLKEKNLVPNGASFILQEFVKGVEVDTEVWFSNGKPVPPFNNDFETKKFMPGDLGPNTGCESSVILAHSSEESMILQKTVQKVFKTMEKEKWTCVLGFNAIVSEKDQEPYGLEWTARMGYSSVYAMCAMCDGNLGEMFYGLASGKIKELPITKRWGTSLRASSPPYPLEFPEDPKVEEAVYKPLDGQKVFFKKDKNLWLGNVKKNEEGEFVMSGDGGIVAECSGAADSLPRAWKTSQKVFDDLKFPNKQGRYIDGIESATKRVNQLREWGYDMPTPNGPAPVSVTME
jgi:phosphoribosylamine---glycine ligase